MKKIFIMFITLTFLTSCYKQESIQSLPNQNSDFFNKKKECSSLYNEYFNFLKEKYWKITNEIWDYQIEDPKIYYSPKLNSCIAYTEIIEKAKLERTNIIYNIEIIDILSKEIIDWVRCLREASWEKINWIPQFTIEDINKFSDCTKIIHEKLEELKK
jgi:hypothetical protein